MSTVILHDEELLRQVTEPSRSQLGFTVASRASHPPVGTTKKTSDGNTDCRGAFSSQTHTLTLLLLLDAFRPDYIRYTPFIRSLARQSATGFLRECFGFLPRAAYFGGLDAGRFGFTNMYCFDPENSIFSSARTVAGVDFSSLSELQAGLRRFVENKAHARVSSFAKHYVSTAQIPLAYLPYFDLAEKRAPWDKEVGFESLFALLDRQNIPWHQCSWPESNHLTDCGDGGIVRHVLRTLLPDHRFAYVHLQELDGIGHVYGPNSHALQSQLAKTDELCRQLIETVRKNYQAVNVILFGDHGMVNVVRTLDLTPIIESTKLRFGSDFAYFLDSTMARFWFYHRSAEQSMRIALREIIGGHLLSNEETRRFGIADCDYRNGQLIFLADPGVLLFPNFFQAEGEPIKGMHGYDPDCADNLGIFLLHHADQPELAGRQLGKVNPNQIFPLLQQLIGLPAAPAAPVLAVRPDKVKGRFTAQPDADAEATVQKHMGIITAAVHETIPGVEALVLTGSFGRGEGGVFQDESGEWRPVNDYDIFVVSPKACSRKLKELSEALVRELGLDYLDLGWTDGKWSHWPLTVANYDLKYGSQVIAGNATVLNTLPAYASADLPVYEAVKLLLNRTAGLLTGLHGEMFCDAKLTADQHRYLSNQIAKAQMALGDSYLIRWEGYDASYRLRRDRFKALASGAGLSTEVVKHVTQGYDFKLKPDYSVHANPIETIRELRSHLEIALIETINRMGNGKTKDLASAMSLYLTTMSEDAGWVQSDNAFFFDQPSFRQLLKTTTSASVSLRHVVYSALPTLLVSAFVDVDAEKWLEASRQMMAGHFKLPEPAGARFIVWENLRAATVTAWFAVHH